MKVNMKGVITTLCLIMCLTTAALAVPGPVTIVNPGFELPGGGSSFEDWSLIPGWNNEYGSQASAAADAVNAHTGIYRASLHKNAGKTYQLLSATFVAGERYELEAFHMSSWQAQQIGMYFYYLPDAGNPTIAGQTVITSQLYNLGPNKVWPGTPMKLSLDVLPGAPYAGKAIGIGFWCHSGKWSGSDDFTLTASELDRRATSPVPADGSMIGDFWQKLNWTKGMFANYRKIFFGPDFNDVNDMAASASLGTTTETSMIVGHPNSNYPYFLQPGETYYWRSLEANDGDPCSPWVGPVWSFTIGNNVELPVVPTAHAWDHDTTETTTTLTGMITDDGNDICHTWFSYQNEFEAGWNETPHGFGYQNDDLFTADLKNLIPGTNYQMRAHVANLAGTFVSQPFIFTTLGTQPSFFIWKHPKGRQVRSGAKVEFSVEAIVAGDVALSYVWNKTAPDGSQTVVGNGAKLVISDVAASHEGNYSCMIIAPGFGVLISGEATLTVEQLVAHWKLDGDLTDATGHGWDGVHSDEAIFGKGAARSQALVFPRMNAGRVTIPNSEQGLNCYPHGLTVSAWVRSNKATWTTIVSKINLSGIGSGWNLTIHPDGRPQFSLRGYPALFAPVNIKDGLWHMVTGTYDAQSKQMRIFVDGEYKGDVIAKGELAVTDKPVIIGAADANGRSTMYGSIDDVRIYNYRLPHYEVDTIMAEVLWEGLIY